MSVACLMVTSATDEHAVGAGVRVKGSRETLWHLGSGSTRQSSSSSRALRRRWAQGQAGRKPGVMGGGSGGSGGESGSDQRQVEPGRFF